MTDKTLLKARKFAAKHHAGKLYDSHPYTFHLDMTEEVIDRFIPEDHPRFTLLKVCSQLHDVVEDTDVTVEQIESEFGTDVAMIIAAVTDSSGTNRKDRKSKTYPRIRAAGDDAIIVKLADRIANIEHSSVNSKRLYDMYVSEHHIFYGALFDVSVGHHTSMWDHILTLI